MKERGFSTALEGAGGAGGDLRTLRSVAFDTVELTPELLTEARKDRTPAAQASRMAVDGRPRVHAAQGYHLGKPRSQTR